MPFISENRLEEALVKAVKQPQTAAEFWRLLLDSDLLVLGTAEGHEADDQSFTLQAGGQLKLVSAQRDGRPFLPVFSSLPRMQEWVKQDSRYLSVNGRALFELTRGVAVILNPASEYGRELTAEQIGQLLSAPPARAPRTLIGEADLPMPLANLLIAIFAKHPDVSAAWMIQATFADRALSPHPVVGIETTGDMKALAQEIGQAAGAQLPDLVFDLQQVVRANPQGLAEAMLQTPPFYQRNTPAQTGRTLN